MFAHLRDMLPKPKSIKEAYQHLLIKWGDTDEACQIGLQVGMIFPDPTLLYHYESTKQGGSDTTGTKKKK